jgi:hypothetical protein
MRAATRERMISIMALVLVISIGFRVPMAAAQSDKYSKMAPVDQYLMERNVEILLAQRAADASRYREFDGCSQESMVTPTRVSSVSIIFIQLGLR